MGSTQGEVDRGTAPGSARMRVRARDVVAAYRPIVSGGALALCAYLVFNAFKRVTGSGDYTELTALVSMGLAAGCAGVFFAIRRTGRLSELEAGTLLLCFSVLCNVSFHLLVSFEFENLVYFIIMMPVFGCLSPSLRSAGLSVGTSLACLVFFLFRDAPDELMNYLSVALAGMLAALSIALLVRRTIIDAIRARAEAVRDREEAERLALQTRRIADNDALTGLPNRRTFFRELEARLERLREQDTPFLLGLIDLDGFKPVNDSYGHAAGDALLKMASARLRELCPRDGLTARLGGDEFAILVPMPASRAAAQVFGQRVCDALSAPYEIDGEVAHVSGSIGLMTAGRADLDTHQLMERADHALYHAKRNHRGEAVMFDAGHEAELFQSGRIDRALRRADLDAELVLLFQPQFDLTSGKVCAFEALARWHSPELGLVAPDVFIPAAERANLIRALTVTLFSKALKELKAWPAELRLSFNLSAHDLMSADAVSRLRDMIEQSGIDPARVEFEITETAMMADFEKARASIERLAALGCSIAVDDFGVGYSNFGYLHELPVRKIKIDRSFVGRLLDDRTAAKIVKTLIGLARSLDMECVVEGVETERQLEVLKACEARFVQGFLLGRPMGAGEVTGFADSAPAPERRSPRRRV